MSDTNPLVDYETGGQASVINYNVPLPTSYSTRSLIELDFPKEIFQQHARTKPEITIRDDIAGRSYEDIKERLRTAIERGYQDTVLFSAIDSSGGVAVQPPKPGTIDPVRPRMAGESQRRRSVGRSSVDGSSDADATARVSEALRELANSPGALEALSENLRPHTDGGVAVEATRSAELPVPADYQSVANYYRPLAMLSPDVIASHAQNGEFMFLRPTLHGDLLPSFKPEPQEAQPQFAIVERYQLSNFLGNYGAGRTVKTFSLLPGEETTIKLKTFKNNSSTQKEASSIFEGSTREAAVEFQRECESELTTSTTEEEKSFWKAGGNAELNLGVFKMGGGGGGGGSSHAVREHTAKSVARASSKHANKSSSKREIEVKTESSQTSEEGTEELIERRIENINLSRTLNLVFRQMNQQFLSLFHLTDVRVAYSNGYPGSYREAPLYEMDDLVADVVTEDNQADVKEQILSEITDVFDHTGTEREDFVEAVERGGDTYHRVADVETTFTDDSTDLSKTVPGIVLSGTVNSLRTDGVIVEALLGRGEALDDYSRGLQTEAVRSRGLQNDMLKSEVDRNALGMRIVENGPEENAERFRQIFGEADEEEEEPETPVQPNDD